MVTLPNFRGVKRTPKTNISLLFCVTSGYFWQHTCHHVNQNQKKTNREYHTISKWHHTRKQPKDDWPLRGKDQQLPTPCHSRKSNKMTPSSFHTKKQKVSKKKRVFSFYTPWLLRSHNSARLKAAASDLELRWQLPGANVECLGVLGVIF